MATANTELEKLKRLHMMRLLEQSVCEDSLYEFARRAWPQITRRPFIDNWHLRVICDLLERVLKGEVRRAVINIPPRCMKSYLVDVFFPVWAWIHKPDTEFMNISHKRALATRDTVKSRRLIQSAWFQGYWGDRFALSSDQNEKMRYENDQGGVRMAQGMDSGITGEGGDCLAGTTMIATEAGDVSIADLHAMATRPRVWSRSADGRLELRHIIASRVILARPTVRLDTLAGHSLQCTDDHRIWTPEGYRPAKDFAGRALPTLRPTAACDHAALAESRAGVVDVYDIQVEGNHNFFAGGILVHNCILIDDPHDRKKAHSEAERTRALETFDEEISTRLNDPDTGAIVIIMQRLHEEDLTGHVLAGDELWEHLMLPMEFEPDRADPRDPRTQEGELLWPSRFTRRSVDALKERLGAYGTAGQFQQRPSPKGGGIWKVEYIKACRREGPRLFTADGGAPVLSDMHVFNVADFAYSSKQSADYSVIGTFAGDSASGRLYLIDLMRARIDLMGTVHGAEHRYHLMSQRAKHRAMYTVVEHVSYSTKIVEFARREGEPIREVLADKDKVTRAYSAIPLCEAGQFYALHDARWWPELWAELAAFPNGAHDDMADVVAYGLLHWREMILPAGVDLSVFSEVLTDYVP